MVRMPPTPARAGLRRLVLSEVRCRPSARSVRIKGGMVHALKYVRLPPPFLSSKRKSAAVSRGRSTLPCGERRSANMPARRKCCHF